MQIVRREIAGFEVVAESPIPRILQTDGVALVLEVSDDPTAGVANCFTHAGIPALIAIRLASLETVARLHPVAS